MKHESLEFFCTDHQMPLSRREGAFRCSVAGCENVIFRNKDFFDSMATVFPIHGIAFSSVIEANNFLVVLMNRLVARSVLPLITGCVVDGILNRYHNSGLFIECGCGEGTGGVELLRNIDCSIVLVDSNNFALKATAARLQDGGINRGFQLLKADFYDKQLPFPDKFFDVSFNIGTIEHFKDPVKAVREMARIAKWVICSVPAPSPFWWIGTQIRRVIEENHTLWTERTNYYDLETLAKIFRDAGLRNVQTSQTRWLGVPIMNCASCDA